MEAKRPNFLNAEQRLEMMKRLAAGETYVSVARALGVSRQAVTAMSRRITKPVEDLTLADVQPKRGVPMTPAVVFDPLDGRVKGLIHDLFRRYPEGPPGFDGVIWTLARIRLCLENEHNLKVNKLHLLKYIESPAFKQDMGFPLAEPIPHYRTRVRYNHTKKESVMTVTDKGELKEVFPHELGIGGLRKKGGVGPSAHREVKSVATSEEAVAMAARANEEVWEVMRRAGIVRPGGGEGVASVPVAPLRSRVGVRVGKHAGNTKKKRRK